jgi:hypothetical protein
MATLSEIQKKLKAPKSQFNAFGKYHYRNCEDILEAVKPHLGESTLTISDKMVDVGGRIYVEATATFKAGDVVETVTAYAREADSKKGMDEAQVTGAASSYARKYALNGLFLIDDTRDADTCDNSKNEKVKIQPKAEPDLDNEPRSEGRISAAQHRLIEAEMSKREINREAFKAFLKVAHITDLTTQNFSAALEALKKKPLKAGA